MTHITLRNTSLLIMSNQDKFYLYPLNFFWLIVLDNLSTFVIIGFKQILYLIYIQFISFSITEIAIMDEKISSKLDKTKYNIKQNIQSKNESIFIGENSKPILDGKNSLLMFLKE